MSYEHGIRNANVYDFRCKNLDVRVKNYEFRFTIYEFRNNRDEPQRIATICAYLRRTATNNDELRRIELRRIANSTNELLCTSYAL